MQIRHTDALPLAPRPNLGQYRTLAKDLTPRFTFSEEWESGVARRIDATQAFKVPHE
jgi:hypothetical protein